jgi:Mg/Co/Ni transporter MgtE
MDVFNALSPALRVGAFSFLRPSEKSLIILNASIGDAEAYVLALPAAERLDAIQTISGIEKVLHVLTAEEKTACDLRRQYPKNSVGAIMHRVPDGSTLLSSLTVREAVAELSRGSTRVADPRRLGGIFLVRDGENRLLGWTEAVTLLKINAGVAPADAQSRADGAAADGAPRTGAGAAAAEAAAAALAAVAARPQQDPANFLLLSVLQPLVHVLRVADDTDELLRQALIATVPLLPVVDADGLLVGVIRPRDAHTLMQTRIAFLSSGDGDSYSKSSVLFLVRKRIVWLLILAVLNFGVAAVVGSFEATLEKNLVLAGFIPLLAGMGGNIGAQASGLVIAAVSSRDISRHDHRRVLKKETLVSFVLAGILLLVTALMGYLRGTDANKGGIALVLGSSMAVVCVVSNLLGVIFPFAALAFGIDPAVASTPLITTVIDVLGISIYLGIAVVVLGI